MPSPSKLDSASPHTPRRSRRRWKFVRLFIVALMSFVLLVWAVGCTSGFREFLARSMVWGPNTDRVVNEAEDLPESNWKARGVTRQLRFSVGRPEVSLSVWIIDPSRYKDAADSAESGQPLGTILVFHGIQDQKSSMLGIGQSLAEAGYRAVLIDSRGHGRSTGQWLTFGVHEARDYSELLDRLDDMKLLAGPVGVYGVSYGGSSALQLAGIDPRVKAVVTVSAFTSMRDVVPRHVRIYAPVVGWFMSNKSIQQCVTRAGEIAGFNPDDSSPLHAIARSNAHVLLIHGADDWRIPPSHAEALHRAAMDRSEVLIVSKADHGSIMSDPNGELTRRTAAWFARWLGGATPPPVD